MKIVQVLMSTYNGEKYLKEQIDSILLQEGVNVNLLVRDDGSSDNTIEILDEYKKQGKLDWYKGENLRSAKSFMDLLKHCGRYDYFAFSDQDDVWKKEKLCTAIKKIEQVNEEKPILYFCDKELVDANLNHLEHKKMNYIVSFESAMIRNIATGCTMVMNKALVDLINSYSPDYIVMHDAWIYRVCIAIGGICIYDTEEHIEYRQHENNVIGAQEGFFNRLKRRWKSFWNCDHSREKTSNELLKGYSKYIKHEYLEDLEQIAKYRKSFKHKVKLFFNKKMKTESLENNIIFKIAVLINKI